MSPQQAKDLVIQHGKYKDKKLSFIPSFYLKWLAANWNNALIREAAVIVLNERSKDVGEKGTYKAKSTIPIKREPKPTAIMEAFGELKEALESAPADLF